MIKNISSLQTCLLKTVFNSHHQDEGAQAFRKSLTHQQVSDVEYLHHFVHENLLPSHDATDAVRFKTSDRDKGDE